LARAEATKSRFRIPELQSELLAGTVRFVSEHIASHGVADVVLISISNSYGLVDLLSSMVTANERLHTRPFSPISSLESAHAVADRVLPVPDRRISIYLQGWTCGTGFPRGLERAGGPATAGKFSFGDVVVERHVIDQASRAFMGIVGDLFKREY
jgi:hypothetical protein